MMTGSSRNGGTLLVVAVLVAAAAGPAGLRAQSPELERAQEELLQAQEEFARELARLKTYLGYYDQILRMEVVGGRISEGEATRRLAAKGRELYERGLREGELETLLQRHRGSTLAYLQRVERAVARGARWPSAAFEIRAQVALDGLRETYDRWVGRELDVLPLLERANEALGWARGHRELPADLQHFAGQAERVVGAVPSGDARRLLSAEMPLESSPRRAGSGATGGDENVASRGRGDAAGGGGEGGALGLLRDWGLVGDTPQPSDRSEMPRSEGRAGASWLRIDQVQHNVDTGGRDVGMILTVSYALRGLSGRTGQIAVNFVDDQNRWVPAADRRYTDGQGAAAAYTSRFQITGDTRRTFTLFIPYSALGLPEHARPEAHVLHALATLYVDEQPTTWSPYWTFYLNR